jgi:LEA14-like dessication related protein
MTRVKGLIGALCLGLLLSGCASVMPDIDPPKVTVEKVESIPSESGAPRFQISLRVINPNTQSLDIAGISYGVEIMGQEVVTGVTNDVPVIEGYSEGVVTLDAGLQLFQVFRLLTSLGKSQGEALEYRFVAKIDFKGLVPTQHVEQKGEVTL